MNIQKRKLLCAASMEGIFTAVYEGWRWSCLGEEVEICVEEDTDPELFCTPVHVETDLEKAEKVRRTIQKKLGMLTYEAVCYAAVSTHPGRGTAIFYVLRQALGKGRQDRRVMEDLADPCVNLVWKLRTKVWHELHRFYGFVRFRETGGILYSEIYPENDILLMLGPHFSDRFPNENWMIYDSGRRKVLVHPKGSDCTLKSDVDFTQETGKTPGNPEEYEVLWRTFCESITIMERKNPGLQRQLLPFKFRSNMVEFSEKM